MNLKHLVRLRWDELNPTERRNFASAAVDLMSEIADPCEEWALKSQAASLVAEVWFISLCFFLVGWDSFTTLSSSWFTLLQIVRREGVSFWQELFPRLLSMSNQGPIQVNFISHPSPLS